MLFGYNCKVLHDTYTHTRVCVCIYIYIILFMNTCDIIPVVIDHEYTCIISFNSITSPLLPGLGGIPAREQHLCERCGAPHARAGL